jgi:hypothetical protein
MDSYRTEHLTIARSGHGELPPGLLSDVPRRRISRVETLDRRLRCVSNGYLSDGCSCESRIPAAVVVAAWRRELERGQRNGGFFQFAWRGEMWLAYGLDDGRIRGVYCPTHRAAREARSAPPGDAAAPIALSA